MQGKSHATPPAMNTCRASDRLGCRLSLQGGAYQWKPELEKRLPTMDKQMRDLCSRLLGYDNVPNKQKTFVNFAKNSLALNKQPQLAEKMWELVQDIIKKPPVENQKPASKGEENGDAQAEEDEVVDNGEKKKRKKAKEEEQEESKGSEEEGKSDMKKKKKKKERQEEASGGGEEEEEEESEEERRKRRKAEKKARKAAAEAEAAKENKDNEDDMSEETDKEKKKKDKKRKKCKTEEAAAAEEEAEDKSEEEAKGKKKDKKRKKKEADDEDEEDQEPAKPKKHSGPVANDSRGFGFYKEKDAVKSMAAAEVDKWRKENNITVLNLQYNPILSFSNAPMQASLMECTRTFEKPSIIQAQCWPALLAGRDIVGIAATGSGKTLAFGLPGLTHLIERGVAKQNKTTSMLVLAPTRELAMQSDVVLKNVGAEFGIRTVCIYGGAPKHEQKTQLKAGCQVLVATPGRLIDFMQEGVVDLSKVSFLVLDEADRMMDVGFEKEVRSIIGACAKVHQTAMFSATWPQSIIKISEELLHNPARVTVGSEDLAANHRVKQIVEVLEPAAKDRRLLEVIKKYHNGTNRIIIFALYKKECDRVHQLVESRTSFKVGAIHGDRGQEQRTKAIGQFKEGKIPLLIATDVAARGLDIPDVEFVINYTFPLTTEDYVHRIGRTGRAGKEGVSHTFFTQFDKARAGELVNVLREAKQEVPEELMKFGTHVKKKEHGLFGAHFKDVDMSVKASKKTFDDSDDE
jgi:ATP-dependent RNA helicase DBP3